MRVTVDANVLFACLIKSGETRRMWFHPKIGMFAPGFIISEFMKYRAHVEKKSKLGKVDFEKLLENIVSEITIIEDRELLPYLPAAVSLISDSGDQIYLACALHANTAIWSNDMGFKKQGRVRVFTTQEIMQEAGYL